jgi:DMSO/TMAO reductase YedYZ molybdopterin-dependent catalytic subunit
VTGLVDNTLSLGAGDLSAGDTLVATLDCTGGFYSTQRWRGIRLAEVIDRAGPQPHAAHVRVVSHTGYRWSFDLASARKLLLATHVGDEPLSHDHGAPVRLVAPGRRGFEWVKWVTRVELHEHGDPGAAASTVWSSLSARGRGAA